jgi:hypothetical protein
MIILEFPGYVIPSQNVRDKTHWAKRKNENDKLLLIARSQLSIEDICPRGSFRYVGIVCFRPRLITDDANFRGGAKGIVDVLKRAGAIYDDKDKAVSIKYEQWTLKHSVDKKAKTLIRISQEPLDQGL